MGQIALSLVVAYLLGALPVGYVVTHIAKRVDIRTVGSGHTGGTNVLRTAGAWAALITVLVDAGKGYAAVAIARSWAPDSAWAPALAGALAVLGHNHSIFLAFKGGVGTMTTFGAALGVAPWGAVAAMLVGIMTMALKRYASLGSLLFAWLLPVACAVGAALGAWPWAAVVFGLITGLFSTWELRHNIRRLRQGTERRIGQKAADQPPH